MLENWFNIDIFLIQQKDKTRQILIFNKFQQFVIKKKANESRYFILNKYDYYFIATLIQTDINHSQH